jgi:hypothetical protein
MIKIRNSGVVALLTLFLPCRQLQSTQLISLYNTSPPFHYIVKLLFALPYVPLESVIELYESVILAQLDEFHRLERAEVVVEYVEQVAAFLAYMERTWIGPTTQSVNQPQALQLMSTCILKAFLFLSGVGVLIFLNISFNIRFQYKFIFLPVCVYACGK